MKKDFIKIFAFLLALWIIHILQVFCVFDTSAFSTSQKNGVFSIITGVFLHANFSHLVSNTSSLLITLSLLLRFYKKDSFSLIALGLFLPSVFVYILGQNVVGISGLVYALLWFLIFAGLSAKDSFKFLLSIVLAMFYAGSLIGITPMAGYGISWQAHLGGFLLAVAMAVRKM